MKKIPFNIPTVIGTENDYLQEVIANKKFCGDGNFTEKCTAALKNQLNANGILLTTSCTHALEMSALLLDIQPGDEVIMPSFTFVSTANAFILRGAKIIFVDIDAATMNISAEEIRKSISAKTKAIIVVHYAGIACDMDAIMKLANENNIHVIEDAAQAIGSFYKGKALGTIGSLGCISFHETKNLHCGEGGALIINDKELFERAEILREKGTNRKKFLMGMVDKYTWVDVGSSYLPSELNAAFLYAQLLAVKEITNKRRSLWQEYYNNLKDVNEISIQQYPENFNDFNAHIFFIKVEDIATRKKMVRFLADKGVTANFHYIPLHTAPAADNHSEFKGIDNYTTKESERLLRLPLYHDLSKNEVDEVCNSVKEFYKKIDSI